MEKTRKFSLSLSLSLFFVLETFQYDKRGPSYKYFIYVRARLNEKMIRAPTYKISRGFRKEE